MHTETIAGLHKCQPKNAPEAGTIKNMVVLNMPAKNGKKAWISIKNKKPEEGGSPYRVLNVEPLDWPPDQYGNVAMNLEVEATTAQPTAFSQARAIMQQGEPEQFDAERFVTVQGGIIHPRPPTIEPQSPPHDQQGEDGVTEARKHLMQTSNLMVLCIKAADYVALQLPEVAHTSEQFAGILGQLFKESYSRRTTDGVNWWSYVDKMPTTPLPPNGKHATTASSKPKNVCTCENTDGDNPLCPIHST